MAIDYLVGLFKSSAGMHSFQEHELRVSSEKSRDGQDIVLGRMPPLVLYSSWEVPSS